MSWWTSATASLDGVVESVEQRRARFTEALGRMVSLVLCMTVAAAGPAKYEACSGLRDYLRNLKEQRLVLPAGAEPAAVQRYLAGWLAADICDPRRAYALLEEVTQAWLRATRAPPPASLPLLAPTPASVISGGLR